MKDNQLFMLFQLIYSFSFSAHFKRLFNVKWIFSDFVL